jgi:hypothetical protein
MQMNMKDFLPAVVSAVEDKPISVSRYSEIACDLVRGHDHFAHQPAVSGSQVLNRLDMSFGDDLNVLWRLRANIAKCDKFVVLEDFGGGNIAYRNSTKNTVRHLGVPRNN